MPRKLISRVQQAVDDDPTLTNEDKIRLNDAIARARIPDTPVYRIIIWMLGVVAVTSIVGIVMLLWCADENMTVPDGLIAIASAAVGALAGAISQTAE